MDAPVSDFRAHEKRFGRFQRMCGQVYEDNRFGPGLADVEAALQERAILDADTGSGHHAGHSAFSADVHTTGCSEVAVNSAHDNDIAGDDAGGYLAVAAHGDAGDGEVDVAFHAALDKQRLQRLCAGDFAHQEEALAEGGLKAGRIRRSGLGFKRRNDRSGMPGLWEGGDGE